MVARTMADKTDAQPGPYNFTTTKTFKIAGPIEITITTKDEGSHVPPARGCGCGGGGSQLEDILQVIQQYMTGQAPQTPDAH